MSNIRAPDKVLKELAEKDYIEGMKYKDIAAKYNVSLNTIKSWKQRYNWNRKSVHTNKKVCTQNNNKELNINDIKEPIVEEILENTDITDKQRLFCVYYIQCFNATKAYQKAYQCDYRVANSHAHKLLYNVVIKEEIKKIHKAISEEIFYSIFDLIRELIELNNVSVCDYINFKNVEENVGTKKKPIYMNVTYTELKEEFEADPKFIKEIYYTKRGPMVALKEADKLLKDILLELENNKIKLKKVDAEIEYMNKRTEEIEGRLF